ncbi:class I SAM-dependent methyltransferase [Microvirga thermotolerans]|uniref:Methyltransferase domain-containing protein n=1 Tax=Microvirga thermotolerans TaxID=2651334 RepID=A0A5P9K0V2_9HYPH|nr:class I SAM-dependent methyltransferase [Microvirga thermotolerans]QFU17185.1 methyltransferase domain-containing protein [Microvirga thermotolerans]
MNAQVGSKVSAYRPLLSPAEEDRLSALQEALARNRFLPAPPPENVFVGDGDYRAIGAEFLGHFVRIGGLRPSDRVLDIGCGIGRMAVPLTQYLDGEKGRYEGVDPVKEGIEWCVQNVTPVYPNFRFCQVDLAHELYNPGGSLAGHEVVLPFSDAGFDFAAMVSVATHLPVPEISAYAREVMRLLAPGGRLFMTAFLVLDGDVERTGARPRFTPGREEGTWYGDPAAPLAAIGFDRALIEGALQAAGLRIRKVSLGHWRGIDSAHYQDIVIATKPEEAA